jgi:apolipoprotein N-acyltransferase
MTDREVMQQALEALEGWENCDKWVWPETALEQSKRNTTESLAALRAALEQQQAEPVQENKTLIEWKEQGEAIMEQAGVGFWLGAWWADRPWRK